jgi:pimeloyl-ACP methyl ester carboxylesterase
MSFEVFKILKYLVYFAIGYTLIVTAACAVQRRLLYFPDRSKPSSEQMAAMGLKYWPAASEFKGVMSTNAPQLAVGTVIVFHGNAGAAWHRDYFIHALEPLGYRVILAEYPGYGGRTGKMNEDIFSTDAKEIISEARSAFGDPIYLFGESMGCGVAAAAAADTGSRISGLALVTPWDSLPSLAQTHYWYLPARWLVKDRYNSIENLTSFRGPVAVAMADKDQVIPRKHTMKLYHALTMPKRLWTFKNAGHNSWPSAPEEPWWKEIMSFISS